MHYTAALVVCLHLLHLTVAGNLGIGIWIHGQDGSDHMVTVVVFVAESSS